MVSAPIGLLRLRSWIVLGQMHTPGLLSCDQGSRVTATSCPVFQQGLGDREDVAKGCELNRQSPTSSSAHLLPLLHSPSPHPRLPSSPQPHRFMTTITPVHELDALLTLSLFCLLSPPTSAVLQVLFFLCETALDFQAQLKYSFLHVPAVPGTSPS